ncbi:MAG: hypothetical protein IKV37_05215, partial [Prevotella sp.]|nr:hypothetical protein [Prevotella sp.]
LVSVIIGRSLETLRPNSFGNCYKLKDVYCYTEKVPTTSGSAFANITLKNVTLHVPESSIIDYKITSPWKSFGSIVGMSNCGNDDSLKCAKPTIYYSNGTLIFKSETKGAEFVSEITDADIKKYYDNEILLTVTYNISVYATKSGYEDSEVATATLCWIDVDPKTEGISVGTTGAKQIEANAVLIQSENGQISVSGANDGTAISVFSTDGLQVGSAVSRSGQAVINTNLSSGSIAIVKIGNRSVKVAVK